MCCTSEVLSVCQPDVSDQESAYHCRRTVAIERGELFNIEDGARDLRTNALLMITPFTIAGKALIPACSMPMTHGDARAPKPSVSIGLAGLTSNPMQNTPESLLSTGSNRFERRTDT